MIKILAATSLFFLLNCGGPTATQESLEITAPTTLTLKVGDTSAVFKLSKTSIDERGRSSTESNYKAYTLVVGDSTVTRVVNLVRIIGTKMGETTIKANDNSGSLQSNTIKVTVVAAP